MDKPFVILMASSHIEEAKQNLDEIKDEAEVLAAYTKEYPVQIFFLDFCFTLLGEDDIQELILALEHGISLYEACDAREQSLPPLKRKVQPDPKLKILVAEIPPRKKFQLPRLGFWNKSKYRSALEKLKQDQDRIEDHLVEHDTRVNVLGTDFYITNRWELRDLISQLEKAAT